MPYAGQCGISRKIEERSRGPELKNYCNLPLREGMGVIVRTTDKISLNDFLSEIYILMQQWDQIEAKIKSEKEPTFENLLV